MTAYAGQLDDLISNADQGNRESQYRLGARYESGRGVEQDYSMAFRWYLKSAEQGYAGGQRAVGAFYELGRGVEKDPEKAAQWYEKAARQGLARAQTNLGNLYEAGLGVEKDFLQAIRWYEKAAQKGYPRGQVHLGIMYEKGLGVPKDEQTALLWYEKAAQAGYSRGQIHLGRMYENGLGGLQRDLAVAAIWYRKAVDQKFPAGEDYLAAVLQRIQEEKEATARKIEEPVVDNAKVSAEKEVVPRKPEEQAKEAFVQKKIEKKEEFLAPRESREDQETKPGEIVTQKSEEPVGPQQVAGKSIRPMEQEEAVSQEVAVAEGPAMRKKQVPVDEQTSSVASEPKQHVVGDTDLETERDKVVEEEPIRDSLTAEEHFYKGNEYAQGGKYVLAVAEYLLASELDPTNANTYENLAIAHAKNGSPDKAVAAMEKAIQLNSKDAMKRATLGIIYHARQENNKALEQYIRALRINPGLGGVYYNMAVIYGQQEKYESAMKCARLAQELGHAEDDIVAKLKEIVPGIEVSWEETEKASLHLRQIVVGSDKDAEKILIHLNKGEGFCNLARAYSLPPFNVNGGYIGPLKEQRLRPSVFKSIEKLPPFALSPIVETPAGFHIFQKIFVFDELLELPENPS